MNVDQLRERVACRTYAFPDAPGAPVGSSLMELRDEPFIPPELAIELENTGDGPPSVILVYAPAAVGKSVLARNLARVTNNPFWDLAAFRLGSGFFNGMISQTYGVGKVEEFVKSLRAGEVTLILDGADEASVGSTTSGYFAALDDLVGILQGTDPRAAQAVIFGREETILETAAFLQEADVECEVVSVRYFSEESAREFVRTLAVAHNSLAKVLPDMEAFLDEFFGRVQDAFSASEWSEVQSFLGYAPVLDSLATFYREADNPYSRLQEFSAPSSRLAVWELLFDLIRDILERETGKFANSFGAQNEVKRRFAASAYTVPFQIRLLLSGEPADVKADPELVDDIDAEWLTEIDGASQDWFRQHPFMPSYTSRPVNNPLTCFANAAFRDFTLALSPTISDDSVSSLASAYTAAHDVNPTVMLSRFIEVMTRSGELDVLPGDLLAALVDSHSCGTIHDPVLSLGERMSPEEDSGGVLLTFGAGQHSEGVDLVVSAGDEVALGRQVSNVTVHLPGRVVSIGGVLSESQLGPRLFIKCRTIASRCPEVRVFGSSQEGVVIEASSISGGTRVVHSSGDSLMLRMPPVSYPWERFRSSVGSSGSGVVNADLIALGVELRTISTWFSLGSGSFSRKKMDEILAKGRASKLLFNYLVASDYIWSDDHDYRFSSPVSASMVKACDLSVSEYRRWLEGAYRRIVQE